MAVILVVGGAGYIGSHVVRMLLDKGHEVVVFDNLLTGHEVQVDDRAVFVEGDLLNKAAVDAVFVEHACDAVMHFAALSLVGESVRKPLDYHRNNVVGALVLLEAMRDAGVSKFVFSSSAAVYGEPKRVPIEEDSPLNPTNPYGFTKVAIERMLRDADVAHGLRFVSLRYFNAAGAGEGLGEWHEQETHLIPLVLQTAKGKRESITIFGGDYGTPDGTCIRDYIHVLDLADAHLRALDRLLAGDASCILNLGSGEGNSVKEVIDVCKDVTGIDFPVEMGERRLGDPAILIASNEAAKEILGWRPTHSLRDIVESAWAWEEGR